MVDPHVEIPVAADIQRRHARIVWQAGRHAVVPAGPTFVNGRPVTEVCELEHGDAVKLAASVSLHYHQPPLLGDTARLDVGYPARATPGCDGVVLLGKTLVLGQSPAAHIVCHELDRAVILVHRAGELFVQSSGRLEVDGERVRGWSRLHPRSRLVCDELALSLEPRCG